MIILSGKELSKHLQPTLQNQALEFKNKTSFAPGLAVVLVGEDPASQVYVNNKEKACHTLGLQSFRYHLPAQTTQSQLSELIDQLNENPQVHGILLQLPLPKGLRADLILERIHPLKDADGFNPINMGHLFTGKSTVIPCTPKGVMALLDHHQISIEGKSAVVIGRSNIVGKPIAQLLLERNATVTMCHSKTKHLKDYTAHADILVVAAGVPQLIGKDEMKKDAVVVDVGIHRQENGKLCGDVKTEGLENWIKAITPVPGGVGPMTIAMLMQNTIQLAFKTLS